MLSCDDNYYVWEKGDHEVFLEAKNFHTSEASCQCHYPECKEQRLSRDLVRRLNQVRVELSLPVLITSGFRCSKHQRDLAKSGAETAKGVSQHELGNAADIKTITPDAMSSLLEIAKRHFSCLGLSPRFLHVDTRLNQVFWTYKK